MSQYVAAGISEGVEVSVIVIDLSEFLNASPDLYIFVSAVEYNGDERQTLVRKGDVCWESFNRYGG